MYSAYREPYLRERMSEFVVSARKYRPARFDTVVGQEHVSETLKNALRQNRLAHAFLFCGPRGVGKTTNARILAKVLNCLNVGEDFEPCNTCSNCVAFNQNASFNIFELDGASNNKVDHMHQLMEQVRIPPQSGRKKVYIIDEVHMLTSQAFNAFLKTLEEPPDYAVFILATTEKHKILPTILSRCQVYDFHRIRPVDMVAHLQRICAEEDIVAEEEALHLIAEKADGALRDALSIFDRLVSSASAKTLTYAHAVSQLNVLDHATFFAVTDALLREDVAGLYLQLDDVLANGFEAEPFLGGLARHLRQLFVCKSPQTVKLLEVSEQLRARYAEQAAFCSLSFLVNALNLAAECDFRMRLATHKRLHVELYLVKMAYAARTLSRDAVSVPSALGSALPAEPVAIPTANTVLTPAAAQSAALSSQAVQPLAPTVQAAPQANVEARVLPPEAPQTEASSASPASFAAPSDAPAPARVAEAAQAYGAQDPDLDAPADQDGDGGIQQPPLLPQPGPSTGATASPASLSSSPTLTESRDSIPSVGRARRASSLPSIKFDDDDDGPVAVAKIGATALSLVQLTEHWLALAEDQPQRIKAVMRRAQLSYAAPEFHVRVGSLLALNILRTEAANIRDIKTKLNCDELDIVYEFDESLAPPEEVKVRPVGPAEQYQILLDANPEVDNLRKRLELDFGG